ncbi:MAG TPA: hypothetical protein DIS79_06825 [Bacteroidetes bacterium]|nr:hypothetical protein [Bacteroidota bacterium]
MKKYLVTMAVFLAVVTAALAVVPVTGPTLVCEGSWPVLLQSPSGYPSYRWNTGATTDNILITAPGTYTVVIRRADGSRDSGSITVREHPKPRPRIGNPIEYLCEGEVAWLRAPLGYRSYTWNTGASGPEIQISTPGYYRVYVTDSVGCRAWSDSIRVVVVQKARSRIEGMSSICTGSTTIHEVVDAPPGSTFEWTALGGTILRGRTSRDVRTQWQGSGRLDVRIRTQRPDGGTCDTTIGIVIRAGTRLQPEITTSSTMICSGEAATLSVRSGYATYRWNTGASSASITVTTAGKYWCDVMDSSACTGTSDTITIIQAASPRVGVTGPRSICAGDRALLVGTTSTNNIVAWRWNTGETTAAITVTQTGTYTVIGSTVNGCTDTARFVLLSTAVATIETVGTVSYDTIPVGVRRLKAFTIKNITSDTIRVLGTRLVSGTTELIRTVPDLPADVEPDSVLSFVVSWLPTKAGHMVESFALDIQTRRCLISPIVELNGYATDDSVPPDTNDPDPPDTTDPDPPDTTDPDPPDTTDPGCDTTDPGNPCDTVAPGRVDTVDVRLVLPDTVVAAGDHLSYNIGLSASLRDTVDLDITMSWDASVWHVDSAANGVIVHSEVEGWQRTMRLRWRDVDLSTPRTLQLHGRTMLRSTIRTELSVDAMEVTGHNVYRTHIDEGSITLTSCWIAGRVLRFQPVGTYVVYNQLGEELRRYPAHTLREINDILVDLPSGSYFIVHMTTTSSTSAGVVVTR